MNDTEIAEQFPLVIFGMGLWMEECRSGVEKVGDTVESCEPVVEAIRNYTLHLLWLEKVYGFVRMRELHNLCCSLYATPDNFANMIIQTLPLAREAFDLDSWDVEEGRA